MTMKLQKDHIIKSTTYFNRKNDHCVS